MARVGRESSLALGATPVSGIQAFARKEGSWVPCPTRMSSPLETGVSFKESLEEGGKHKCFCFPRHWRQTSNRVSRQGMSGGRLLSESPVSACGCLTCRCILDRRQQQQEARGGCCLRNLVQATRSSVTRGSEREREKETTASVTGICRRID